MAKLIKILPKITIKEVWSGQFGVKCIFEIPLIMHWETIKAWEHFNNSPGCCQQAQRKKPIYTNFANLSRYLMD